jgi:ATP/maltotriose-dependent transcriptional regulator MalT
VKRLEEGLRPGHRLTLISTPAGLGKTTLVTEWLHGRPDTAPSTALTWLSLDENDNDPVRFFAYLLAALQKVDPNRMGIQGQATFAAALQVKRFDETRELASMCAHLVATPGLARPPTATKAVGNAEIAVAVQERMTSHAPLGRCCRK